MIRFLLIPVANALPAVQAHLEHRPGDDPPSPDELAELVALTVRYVRALPALDCLADTGSSQSRFIRSASCAAIGELPVNRHGWDGANSQAAPPVCDRGIVHVEDGYLAGRARDAAHELDRVFARWASGTKNFDFAFGRHRLLPV